MVKKIAYILAALMLCTALPATADVIPAEKALQRYSPASETFTLNMSFSAGTGRYYGMAAVALKCAKGVALNTSSKEVAKLYFEGELIATAGTRMSEYSGIADIGVRFLGNDDGLLKFDSDNLWLVMFNSMAAAKFRQSGEYIMEIPEGLFKLGSDPVGGISLRYVLVNNMPEKPGDDPVDPQDPDTPKIPFEHAFTPAYPTHDTFALCNSYMADFGNPQAMASIALSCPKEVTLVKECTEKVQLWRGETMIGEVGASDSGNKGIREIGISLLAPDDADIDINAGLTTYLFAFDDEVGEEFRQPGYYMLKMPTGLFRYEDALIEAGEMHYHYLGDVKPDYSYTISPEPGSHFKVEEPINSVALTINGYVDFLEYDGTPGALYDPEGRPMTFESRYASIDGNVITWNFKPHPANPVEWLPGEYTFRLPRNSININTLPDFVEPAFPTEDLTVLYVLTSDMSAVSVVGAEASGRYTVYTAGGVLVAEDASGEIFLTLPDGVYIINGKKTFLKH